MKSSIIIIEKNNVGKLVVTGYTAIGNDLSGYFLSTYINKKQVSCKGTTSSNGRKKFAKFPKHLIVN